MGKATPVFSYNDRENRFANRGEGERHASHAIQPGDRIWEVNGACGDDEAMLDVLVSATSITSPKALALKLERHVSDVLGPAYSCNGSRASPVPFTDEAPPTTIKCRPPKL